MFRGTSNFDKLLEKATSHLLLEPDWTTTLQLCDLIRQGDIQPKYALSALKKKLTATNPHVVLYALQVLESWVKNCGSPIHQEVATKQFMEELKDLLKISTNESVKNKILELIQTWAHAFRNGPNYRIMQDTVNLMKIEGYTFPVLKESDAMFVADTAPQWVDGEVCHRCRVQFNVVQRKHHCRNCGQVFCAKCSSHSVAIPRFGFEKDVRVCDACWEKVSKPTASTKGSETELPQEYLSSSLAQQSQVPPARSEQDLQEEEDLQLAIALSKSEAENKEKEKLRATSALLSSVTAPAPVPVVSSAPSMDSSLDSDPELARYLNRSYWEHKQILTDGGKLMNNMDDGAITVNSLSGPIPSAPSSGSVGGVNTQLTSPINQPLKINDSRQNGEIDDLDGFVSTLCGSLEIFVNRMQSNSSRGRSIAVDSTVQTFFVNITAMHSQLLKFIQEQDDNRVYYESLQDKLSQAKDARAALDALREEHRERLRRAAEEAERARQIQMAQKLEIMRKKKQEYLEYQRQNAMQRMQEQEREMQLRQEQQKQQYLRQMASGGYQPPLSGSSQAPGPATYAQPPQHGFSSSMGSNDSPVHAGPTPGSTAYPPQYHFPPGSQPQLQQQQQPEYQTFNMHGLVNSLPVMVRGDFPTQQAMPPPPPSTNIGQNQPPSMPTTAPGTTPLQMNPPTMSGPPNVIMNLGPNPNVGHPSTVPSNIGGALHPVQRPPNLLEAELISFD